MTEQEFNQAVAKGDANFIPPQPAPEPEPLKPFSEDDHQPIVETLRRPKRHLKAAPTFTPKTFLDSIQFYDDEDPITPTRRVYFYINKGWRYITVT
jgi:hypothetical protein